MFQIILSPSAKTQLQKLEASPALAKRYKAVLKTLGIMEKNLRHPGLNTHKYQTLFAPDGSDVFESYAQNRTPGAYRVFWHYGPGKKIITVIAIIPHP